MEVDWVLVVDLNGLGKVLDGLVVLLEPVPNQASSVVTRSVVRIQDNHFVEVFKGKTQLVSSHLLANSAKVVESRDVLWLEIHRGEVVGL